MGNGVETTSQRGIGMHPSTYNSSMSGLSAIHYIHFIYQLT
jgi:hypothetical protein